MNALLHIFLGAMLALPAFAYASSKMETSVPASIAAEVSDNGSLAEEENGSRGDRLIEAARVPPQVSAALRAAFTLPDARLDLVGYRSFLAEDCSAASAEASGAIEGSGRVAVRVFGIDTNGAPCEGWSWAEVKVSAEVWITTRSIRQGEALAGAVRSERREIASPRRHLLALNPDARAARSLAAGTVLELSQIASGLLPGEPIQVKLLAGSLSILAEGRGVACGRDRSCATLPSGKRVEGRLEGDLLVVEAP